MKQKVLTRDNNFTLLFVPETTICTKYTCLQDSLEFQEKKKNTSLHYLPDDVSSICSCAHLHYIVLLAVVVLSNDSIS